MAKHNSISELQLAAMQETLDACRILLADENLSKTLFLSNDKIVNTCRYGYPAAILLFSFIDAVGSLHDVGKYKKSFRVLNTEIFDNQNLSIKACDNLYDKYRSGLSHNLALPHNTFLIYSAEVPQTFILPQNNQNEIHQVNLYQLFNLCVNAFQKFREEHTDIFSKSKTLEDILNKGVLLLNEPIDCTTPSGVVFVDNKNS